MSVIRLVMTMGLVFAAACGGDEEVPTSEPVTATVDLSTTVPLVDTSDPEPQLLAPDTDAGDTDTDLVSTDPPETDTDTDT